MKFNYRKIASVLASAVMLSSTAGFAAAANYPAPFVAGGSADGAIIVGVSANPSDWSAAFDLSRELSARVSSSTTTTTTAAGGDAKSLASGSDLLYFGQTLSTNIESVTDSDLETVLADGVFTDDAGVEYKYEQTIIVSNTTEAAGGSAVTFGDSGGELDDPALMLALSSDVTKPLYTLKVTFTNRALNFSDSDSEGEVIKLFGKEYTISSSTDADTLVLNGGAAETTIQVGEKPTVTVGGESYEISLVGINAGTTSADTKASISVNGDTKSMTEGSTRKIGGVDVYLKTLFKTGDNAGYVVVQLGSDRLTLEHGDAVKIGSEEVDIDGTSVSITGDVGATTVLQIKVAAPDVDDDYLLQGKSFKDPVFGTVEVQLVDLKNAPMLDVEEDTGVTDGTRKKLSIDLIGEQELGLSGLGDNRITFQYQGANRDRNNRILHVYEGATLSRYDTFIVNGGTNNRFILQVSALNLDESPGSDIKFTNVLTGEVQREITDDTNINETAGTSTTTSIGDKTYTITTVNATAIMVTSSDYSLSSGTGKVDVFPFVEPVDSRDVRVAFTYPVTLNGVVGGTILQLPTGDLTTPANFTATVVQTLSLVGKVNYTITSSVYPDGLSANLTIAPSTTLTGNAREGNVSVMLVEEEDKTLSGSGLDIQNAVLLPTSYDGTYSLAKTPVFTSSDMVSSGFDNSKHTGYIDPFGTYALKDTSDADQTITWLTYSANGNQMYANIFLAETGATVTVGGSGSGGLITVFKDEEISSVSNKNLLVVGGSCVNKVALKMIDDASTTAVCGADFTTKTQVGANQYIIKSMTSPYNDAKVAVLVAGFEAADTVNAVAKLKEGVSTSVGTSQVYPIIGTQ